MEMQRKYLSQAAKGSDKRRPGVLNVTPPAPHEGIGRALRSTFRAGQEKLPDDMMDLLRKLGRH